MNINFLLISSAKIMLLLILISGCQVKELSPFEKAKNPYSLLGVEGCMCAAMTSCLGMTPQGPPIVRKKDGNSVIADDHSPEHSGYFDCVNKEIYKIENMQSDSETE